MDDCKRVVIVGGGISGLTAAIHLSKIGIKVTLIEKNKYPKHKVCGEYISNEVIPYLKWLSIDLNELYPSQITKLSFSNYKGNSINCNLPLGGFGLSRFAMDEYLYKKALKNGVEIIQDSVEDILFENDIFEVLTLNNKKITSKFVIGAFGKRSNIDQKLKRTFVQKKSNWLAVKAHYTGDFPNDLVGLHNFSGGYCGVSKIENNIINICYLANYDVFKKFKNIEDFQSEIVTENPNLKSVFDQSKMIYEVPLTISQISFDKKKAIENHVLMIGDTAGLIHPLCGNGMAIAIHSAKIASELLGEYFNNEINSREALEEKYTKEWNFNFRKRLRNGRIIALLLQNVALFSVLMKVLIVFPFLMSKIIRKTHGKIIEVG